VNFSRNTNLIATLVATVVCGCPGLLGLCFGATSLIASFTPGAEIDVFGNTNPEAASGMGALVLCLSLIAIAMPLIVWFATRRKGTFAHTDPDEPIPPAS
jgi:hypothetical protein